jgi:polyhydroxybutyrate depolymerase
VPTSPLTLLPARMAAPTVPAFSFPHLPWHMPKAPAGTMTREVPGWSDRAYQVHVPASYDRAHPAPVVVVLHGHGDNADRERRQVSPGGNVGDPHSLDSIAEREGFVLVYANGTRFGHLGGRFWNADHLPGGPAGIFTTDAEPYIDDERYLGDLLDDLGHLVNVDRSRVFAMGMSNGAAMAQRVGMTMTDRFAAIAAVSGPNQMKRTNPDQPYGAPTPVLEIHGTADHTWPIEGGHVRFQHGDYASVAQTIEGWRAVNHATGPAASEWIDRDPGDGTRVLRQLWRGERGADVELLTVENGGHTWPDGEGFGRNPLAGRTTHDINANEEIWAFFRAHPRVATS